MKAVIGIAESRPELEVKLMYTAFPKHAIVLSRTACEWADIVVAVGGDGTCGEVLEGWYQSGHHKTALAILPNGTGNDFMRMLPRLIPHEFVEKLIAKTIKKIDIGLVTLAERDFVFFNIADHGFGAKVVALMAQQRRRGLGGKISYVVAILRAFFTYQKSHFSMQGDGVSFKGKALMVAFCNGSTFGHGLVINPAAAIDNGNLCLTVIGDVSLWTYLRHINQIKRGEKLNHPEVYYFQCKSVKIDCENQNTWVEGDGEIFGTGLKEVKVLEKALPLIY